MRLKQKNLPTNLKLNPVNVLEKKQYRQGVEILAQSRNIEPENKVGKHLSIWGIGVTLILFLYLLFVLFQPEKKQSKKKEKIFLEVLDSVDLADKSIIKKNIETIEIEEQVKTTTSPLGVKQSNLELGLESIVNQISEKNEQSEKISLDSIVKAKNSKDLALEPKTTIKSDAMGKVTIITEQTTEIDVISELIKDLHPKQNIAVNNQARQKKIRRKAIWELSQTNDFRAIEPLVKIISEVNSLEKNLILDAITKIATHNLETINQVLLQSLEDHNVKVRKNAIEDLTSLYQSMSAITFHLSKMTLDSDLEVQQTAILALRRFKEISVSIPAVDLNQK